MVVKTSECYRRSNQRRKGFWYLLAYICTDGIWHYADTEEVVEVPLPNGDSVRLTSKPATHVERTLGVLTAPCGGHAAQLAAIRENSDSWAYKILNGHLPASHVWRSYCFQLRAKLLYAQQNNAYNRWSSESYHNSGSTATLRLDGNGCIKHSEASDSSIFQ